LIFENDNDSLSSVADDLLNHETTAGSAVSSSSIFKLKGSASTLVCSTSNFKVKTIDKSNEFTKQCSNYMLSQGQQQRSISQYFLNTKNKQNLDLNSKKSSESMNENRLVLAKLEPDLDHLSISDIDPDENILKNLLVKHSKRQQDE
jgi:hypothetical protein